MIGILTCSALILAALGGNSIFAWSQGRGDFYYSLFLVVVAIGVEGLKLTMPIYFPAMPWRFRIGAIIVWPVAVLLSIAMGLGFVGMTRGEAARERGAQVDVWEQRKAALDRASAELAGLPKARASAAQLTRELETARKAAGPCVDAGATKRPECRALDAIDTERIKADAHEAASERVEGLRVELEKTARPGVADVQSSEIGATLRAAGVASNDAMIRAWLSILFVILIELGGPVALWMACNKPQVAAATKPVIIAASVPAVSKEARALADKIRGAAGAAGVMSTEREMRGSQRALAGALAISTGTLGRWLGELQQSGLARVTVGPQGTTIEWC